MKHNLAIAFVIALTGCTTATLTSMQVVEYENTTEMATHADCKAIDAVFMSYGVFMHSPWERKRAAHIHIKDAAHAKGANAVVMTSNNYGVITDQVQGVAYNCIYGKSRAPLNATPSASSSSSSP